MRNQKGERLKKSETSDQELRERDWEILEENLGKDIEESWFLVIAY